MADRSRLHKAIMFATEKHAGQKRKGTDYDYICHPLEVAQILTEMCSSDDLIIAGILHDVVEDAGVNPVDVENWFGSEVRRLVEAHTHPKEGEWIDRKMAAVESVKSAPLDVKKLVLADKVSNLRSMLSDFKKIGYKLYDRFNAPEEMQRKYYNAMLDALEDLQYYAETRNAYWEATELFKDLFVMYVLKDECIWQVCGDECYVFKREKLVWEPANEPSDAWINEIARVEAERLEDLWKELQDKGLSMYFGSSVYLGGEITDGVLTVESEVYGDDDGYYDSERYYTLTKESTEKLFSLVTVEEFEEIGRVCNLTGLLRFLDRHEIEYHLTHAY